MPHLGQWFSPGGDCSPRGHLAMSGNTVVMTGVQGATGIQWVVVRDVLCQCPTMHRMAPTAKNVRVSNVSVPWVETLI